MKNLIRTGAATILLALSTSVIAQTADLALGIWKTIDEKTNQPSSLIRIEERNGELVGTVVELIATPGEKLITHCNLCKDERKDKPIVGMVIMRGLGVLSAHWILAYQRNRCFRRFKSVYCEPCG